MLPISYGQALNNAGYAQSMNGGSGFDPSAQYAATAGNAAATQAAYNANQQRLAAQAAWQAQQQAAKPNTYFDRVELEKELAYNENEIKALTLELENMRAQWGDLDSMDRQLAANRARIGDFGNSRAHQNDIIARQNDRNRVADTAMQWRWQADQNRIAREADQKKQTQAEIKRLIGEIEDIDAQIPYHTELGAKNALDAKRARLVRELAAYGVTAPAKVSQSNENNSLDNAASILQNEKSVDYIDKKGRFLDAEKRKEIAAAYNKLGLKAEAKRVLETPTVQEANDRSEKVKAEKAEARKLVSKYQNMTEAQHTDFSSRWNRNDPNDKEIQLLRKYATFNGSAPVMK